MQEANSAAAPDFASQVLAQMFASNLFAGNLSIFVSKQPMP
jgi:hypothetical protein